MAWYEVVVGNIGTVYDGNNPVEARKDYGEYVKQSKNGYGRAAGESVTIFKDGDVHLEHIGDCDEENDLA